MDPLGLTKYHAGLACVPAVSVAQAFNWIDWSFPNPFQEFVATQAYVFFPNFGGSTTNPQNAPWDWNSYIDPMNLSQM